MATSKRHLFTVEGSGSFPFDMLRYDDCWPHTERYDSAALQHESRTRRRVVLATNSQSAPTAERWASFNWKVIGRGEIR